MKALSNIKLLAFALMGFFVLTNFALAGDKCSTKECKLETSAYTLESKDQIETKLLEVDGVKDAYLDLEDQVITVKYDSKKVSPDMLTYTLSDLGYDAVVMETKTINKDKKVLEASSEIEVEGESKIDD